MFMKQEILIVWPQNIANMFIKCEIIIVWSQNTGNMFIKQEIIGFFREIKASFDTDESYNYIRHVI